MKIARVGVLLDQKAAEKKWKYGLNVFERYIGEVLSHEGISFDWIEHAHQISHFKYDLILVALSSEDEETLEAIRLFTERGRTVIAYSGINGLAKTLGAHNLGQAGVGYAHLPENVGDTRPLRFLDANPWSILDDSADYENSSIGHISKEQPAGKRIGSVLQRFKKGDGIIDRWSVNIPKTIVGLQQGLSPVFEDGAPAPDGKGPLNDGLLKAEDVLEQDWEWDRKCTETGAAYFAHPYADLWREALISHLLKNVVEKGLTLPVINHTPADISYLSMISHDSDWSSDEAAETVLRLLEEHNIHSTWCMIEPGYSAHIMKKIHTAGHEIALHYNAMREGQGGEWSREEFQEQATYLKETLEKMDIPTPVASNKNHYTRFEGYGELFQWCEENGLTSDQTRGPSKKGDVGFTFATCQPYFPISWSDENNRLYNVLQLGFLTQDIPHWTDTSVIQPFLEQVKRVQGVAHFLFHQGRLEKAAEVREAFTELIQQAKKQGFVFWTASQITEWEKGRREFIVTGVDDQGKLHYSNKRDIQNVLVWIPVTEEQSDENAETYFGVKCRKVIIKQ